MWDPQGAASMTTSSEPLWRPSRRTFLSLFAVSAALAGPLFGRTPSAAAVTKSELLYVSSWRGVNLHGLWFDPAGGIMTPIGPVAGVNSSWTEKHPTRPIIYVGSGEVGGVVYAFQIDRATGAPTPNDEVRIDSGSTSSGGLS